MEDLIAGKIHGNIQGLKAVERRALERLYSRRYTSGPGYSLEQAWELCALSGRLGRQIGLLINRQGKVEHVLLGTATGLVIPPLGRSRLGTGRLRGLGLLHTHLSGEELSQEDLMDLLFLRLDFLAVLIPDKSGTPQYYQYSHLMPDPGQDRPYYVSGLLAWDKADINLPGQVEALEDELSARQGELPAPEVLRKKPASGGAFSQNRAKAILVSVSRAPRKMQERCLAELADLADSAGLDVAEQVFYRPSVSGSSGKMNSRILLGEGRIAELEVLALKSRADMIIFDGELTPAQIDNLARMTERKVLDRTMLILDIFAQRASSRAGKLQVEMAQLQYTLPRLAGRNTGRAMDRLAGGIGGRGPGETKLELDRRKIRDRISRIKLDLEALAGQRELARSQRERAGLPVICLVGYTNTGKSTLLNLLTRSNVYVENQLFATLDSTARRLHIPFTEHEHEEGAPGDPSVVNMGSGKRPHLEAIITDTVGFIRDLPVSLREAFAATLEELDSAALLLHVADASHPDLDLQVESVNAILSELGVGNTPSILVLNKWDLLSPKELAKASERSEELSAELMLSVLERYPHAVPVSAGKALGIGYLTQKIGSVFFDGKFAGSASQNAPYETVA